MSRHLCAALLSAFALLALAPPAPAAASMGLELTAPAATKMAVQLRLPTHTVRASCPKAGSRKRIRCSYRTSDNFNGAPVRCSGKLSLRRIGKRSWIPRGIPKPSCRSAS